ncbi:MAG: YihY family inner membrane protein [Kiritimatiellae bacterium]|nr:YihY family inner membrane protein [Kiritimatiellia bacterium]
MSFSKQQARLMPATLWLVVRESVRSFSRNRDLESAATLAFYGFLSLMPLLLLLVFALSWVVSASDTVLAALSEQLADLFPAFDEALLREIATLARQRVWGAVSLLFLLWSMTPFAGAARHAVISIFKGQQRRTFLTGKAMDLIVVLAVLLLFLLLTISRVLLVALPLDLTQGVRSVQALFSWALSAVVIGIFYRAFASVPLRAREVAVGAVGAALLLSMIRPLFGLLLQFNPNFGYAFGSVKAIFLLLVWVYYTFAVLLFGAELAANTRRREALLLRGFLRDDRHVRRAPRRLLEPFLRRFEDGDVLFREGDAGCEMFFIRAGAVRLTRGEVELRRLGPGDYFGEMSLLLGAPRSATATIAEPDTELVAIAERNMDLILGENPEVVQRLLRDMAARLRDMNERITA